MSRSSRDRHRGSTGPALRSWTVRGLYPRPVHTPRRTRDTQRDGRRLPETRPPVHRGSASAGANPCASRDITGTVGSSHMPTSPRESLTAQGAKEHVAACSHQVRHTHDGSLVPYHGRHRWQHSTSFPHSLLGAIAKRWPVRSARCAPHPPPTQPLHPPTALG